MEGSAVRPGSMPLLVDTEEVPHRNCQRLVLLGSAKVGKTSIVSRFLHDTFDDNYTPTIEDFHRKIYKIRGESYRLDLLDTSGNHPFPAMRRLSLLTGELTYLKFGRNEIMNFKKPSKTIPGLTRCS